MNKLTFDDFKKEVLTDYYTVVLSRKLSLHGRKEVLNGRAKFGILGDGKEVAQVALAKVFKKGDWRSGYYRDQTWMLAKGMITPKEIFAQLYGDTDLKNNRTHGGRLMNNHFGSRNIDAKGNWLNQTKMHNSATDISPTAGQMPRSVGLAYASKLYRENEKLHHLTQYSNKGNEVTFVSIGDASTSEGHFWETLNAGGVLQIPMAISVWDDGWGISVPKELQTTKASISEATKGFEQTAEKSGYRIYKEKGWNYPGLCKMYQEGIALCREQHCPVLFHVEEMVQPQGHSTSGSHERYKTEERLAWEQTHDPIIKMREWILEKGIADEEKLVEIENNAEEEVKAAKKEALADAYDSIIAEREELLKIANSLPESHLSLSSTKKVLDKLKAKRYPTRSDVLRATHVLSRYFSPRNEQENETKILLVKLLKRLQKENKQRFDTFLYSQSSKNPMLVAYEAPQYNDTQETLPGREILRENFHALFSKYPELVTFGEDTGKIGGVNQSLQGLQEEFGALRVTDTGIREATIIGQGIGLAMRGLRPIAEIQYFDYLMYGLQTISDDLASLHYRTVGGQAAPLIIRTRGHRLEGVWHSGSFLSMVINSIRGVYVCVPRNMTKAAGFYNTLLKGDNPALVIEPLNAYRQHEPAPQNVGEYTTPLGIPEIITEGDDITIITYGACVAVAKKAVEQLRDFDVYAELIDVQSLLPFDTNHLIVESIKKTGKVLFVDEDVPGGTTAYMMQKVLEEQGATRYLKTPAKTLTAKAHRPAYGNDGDFFSKPNDVHVFDAVYKVMNAFDAELYPDLYIE